MNADELLQLLFQRGAQLSVADGKLSISAPDGAIDDTLLPLLRTHKPAIMALVQALEGKESVAQPVAGEYADAYEHPVSLAQRRMLFLEELADGRSYYNIPFACRLEGKLDKPALVQALTFLLRQHHVLRTLYPARGDGYVQTVLAPTAMVLHERDLSCEAEPEAALRQGLAGEAEYRFNLQAELPIRCVLFVLGNDVNVLSVNIHHIAADGSSMRHILDDLGRAYDHYRREGGAMAPTRLWQYADYVTWEQRWLASEQFVADRSYWVNTLDQAPQLHSVMTDYPRAANTMVAGTHYRQPLPPALVDAVTRCAREFGTTPFAVYQAGFAALLARYSGESDIVFGTAAANRVPQQFAETVGLFVNTLALRYQVGDDLSFAQLLEQAKQVSAGANRHQAFPFDVLVETLQPKRDPSYNPLVQIMLVMQDDLQRQLELDGLRVSFLEQDQQVSKFDIALHLRVRGDRIDLDWEYNTSLYRASTLEQMSDHLVRLLEMCVAEPGRAVAAIPLVECVQAIPLPDYEVVQSVHVQFEAQLARHPGRIALQDGQRTITYQALDEMAERVAGHLAQAGAQQGAHIGVCLERCAELVAAMLGIYKMGGVYVPLDPNYPPERLAFMIDDSGISLLLSDAGTLPPGQLGVPVLDVRTVTTQDAATGYLPCTDPAQGAYVIYTSGSTGKPKGVLVTQSNLFYSLRANRAAMEITERDSLPTIGSQAFGVSLLEILLPLTSGGTVQLVTKAQVADIDELVRATHQVTVLHAVPSVMRLWLEAVSSGRHLDPYPHLRLLLVGGESVPDILLQKIKQWRPRLRLLELYGMTESTIVCSRYEPGAEPGAHYCIGKPYPHAAFHVLNACGQEQPIGVPGELYIGGASIAAGYLNQPELTRERFLANPQLPGDRMYRTGDRVRRLADGNFEFLGRVDHQVSLRGARIELGEIETLANAVAGVNQAVAHVFDTPDGDAMLVLSYTSSLDSAQHEAVAVAIRAHLAQGLPDYMQPSIVQCLERFPLNPNGKVDRKKLPAPTLADKQSEPATETERKLLELAWEVLQRTDFGVCANFFEIGGHSLAASRLVAKIRSAFGIAFPLRALYTSPSVRACAALVEAAMLDRYAATLKLSTDQATADGDDMLI